jgi:capsular polysaccharide biosynthesis protein
MMPRKMRPRIFVNFALAVITSLIVGIFFSFMLEWLDKNAKKVKHASGKEHGKNSNSL